MKIIIFIAFILVSVLLGILVFIHLYGNRPKIWKPLLFSKKDTFKSIFFPNGDNKNKK